MSSIWSGRSSGLTAKELDAEIEKISHERGVINQGDDGISEARRSTVSSLTSVTPCIRIRMHPTVCQPKSLKMQFGSASGSGAQGTEEADANLAAESLSTSRGSQGNVHFGDRVSP
jgi:hypothetical protein